MATLLPRPVPVDALVNTRTEYARVYDVYLPIALAVFAIILMAFVFVVARYRGPREPVSRAHEHNPLEVAYALAIAAICGVLLYVTFSAERQTDDYALSARERPNVVIDVIGAKWEWHFHYVASGIDRYSGTVGHQDLVVPTDSAVQLRFTSVDVIHSFWIPELDIKRAVIPDHTNVATLDFPTAGVFNGQCAEFCGLDHYEMTFTVRAIGASAFRQWVARNSGHPLSPRSTA